jgi:hypothetical protein
MRYIGKLKHAHYDWQLPCERGVLAATWQQARSLAFAVGNEQLAVHVASQCQQASSRDTRAMATMSKKSVRDLTEDTIIASCKDSVEVTHDRHLLGVTYTGLEQHEQALEQNEISSKGTKGWGAAGLDLLQAEIDAANIKIVLGKFDDAVLHRPPWPPPTQYGQFEKILRVMMDCKGHMVESCFIVWSNVADGRKLDILVDGVGYNHLGISVEEADCSRMVRSVGEGSSMFPSMEHSEAFQGAVPHKVEQSLCSEDADLGSLAARLIGLCTHAMLVKHGWIVVRSVLLLTPEEVKVVSKTTDHLLLVLLSSAWSGTEIATTLRLQDQIQHQDIMVLIDSGSSHTFLINSGLKQLFMSVYCSAWSGTTSHQTLKLKGSIQEQPLNILLDGGSKHTFVNDKLIPLLSRVQSISYPTKVQVVNGLIVSGRYQWLQAHWQIQEYEFVSDLLFLPLPSLDMVVDIDWLATFSSMRVDWVQKWLAIPYKGSSIVLYGQSHTIPSGTVVELWSLDSEAQQSSQPSYPPQTQSLLLQFAYVLRTPFEAMANEAATWKEIKIVSSPTSRKRPVNEINRSSTKKQGPGSVEISREGMSASKARAELVSIHGSRAKASSVLMQWAQVCVRSILLLVSQGNFSVFIWDPGGHAKNSLGTSCISRSGECQQQYKKDVRSSPALKMEH